MSAIANDNATPRTPRHVPDYTPIVGEKHDAVKGLTTTQIAALIRADIKAAQKAGKLNKGVKASIKTSYFSGGSSIDIKITEAPFAILSDVSLELARRPNEIGPRNGERYTAEAQAALDFITAAASAYNRSVTDLHTDYFERRFWLHVEYDRQLEKAEKAAYVAHFGEVR